MGIADAINDLMDLVETSSIKFCRIWNNQFQWMEEQQIEAFPMPCCFIETILPNDQAAIGITVADCIFRVHIGMNELDSGTGRMEENINIFTLRDEIISLLTYKELSGCSGLQKINEEQDYSHTNVYHYIIDFKCSFVDTKGDKTQGQITNFPTDLELNPITIVTEI
jgi:hypothetical protein